MKLFKKYPSTIQLSGIVKHVRDHCKYHNLHLPVINFTGSVKLHGTNATFGHAVTGESWFQSRERIISYESDNAGFAAFGEQNQKNFEAIYNMVCLNNKVDHDYFYLTGEWFGPAINKGVAINLISEKKFGIFEMIFVKDEKVFQIDPKNYHEQINVLMKNVFVIDSVVAPINVTIDFSAPHLVQNFLLEETMKIENECPIGKYFGVSGIGEGLVYSTTDVDWIPRWKTKGEKHSASKVKTVHELTDAEIASKENSAEFVEYACSQNRLEQGIAKLGEMGLEVEMKSMGAFLKWLGNDILTECKDVILESKLERKDIMPKIADKARNWFITNIDTGIAQCPTP